MQWPVIIAGALICCLIGGAIGSPRGQGNAGALLGLFLGPIGVLLCLTMKTTPEAEAARLEAIEAERARIRQQQAAAAADDVRNAIPGDGAGSDLASG